LKQQLLLDQSDQSLLLLMSLEKMFVDEEHQVDLDRRFEYQES